MDMDDSDDEQEEMTMEQKEERKKNLVAPLPAEEWGSKTQKPLAMTASTSSASQPTKGQEGKKDRSMPAMRPPLFAKQQFDGVESDSDDDVDESDLPPVGTIGRKIAEMKWGDMGPQIEEISDDEGEEGDEEGERKARQRKLGLGDDIDEQMQRRVWGDQDETEEDMPQVVGGAEAGEGEEDVDMAEEEEEFLKFSKEALGIDEEMWESILSSRRERGGESCPSSVHASGILTTAFVPKPSQKQDSNRLPGGLKSAQRLPSGAASASADSKRGPEAPERKEGEPNMDLNSFDKVMAAMDAELARIKGPQAPQASSTSQQPAFKSQAKSKKSKNAQSGPLPSLPTEADLDDMDEDDLLAMDRELKAALKSAGVDDVSDDEIEEAGMLDEDGKREYQMMKDFLESYKSQGGSSGVVGNLFGRLGEKR